MIKSKLFFVFFIGFGLMLTFGYKSAAQNYPEMIPVTGGAFNMGNELGEGNDNELPVHTDSLNSFSIAKTETTVAQWKIYCEMTGKEMPEAPHWGWHDNDPVININWDEAAGYCEWLSKKTGKLYRLPTEAEYEYAARGGNISKGFKFSGSDNLEEVGWFNNNSGGHPHAVATKQPNELGLYDMSGNVWEWCGDWYGIYRSTASANPKGASTGAHRVLRGGSWYAAATFCRVACRNYGNPAYTHYFGFRVVCAQ